MLFSAELNVPVKAYSPWGVHLLLVEARGEGGAPLAGEGGAPVDALRPLTATINRYPTPNPPPNPTPNAHAHAKPNPNPNQAQPAPERPKAPDRPASGEGAAW